MSNLLLLEEITFIAARCQETVDKFHEISLLVDELNRKCCERNWESLYIMQRFEDIDKRLSAIEKRLMSYEQMV